MRNTLKLSLTFGLMIFCLSTLKSADRHVSLSGNDANPGTAAQPWRTLKHAGETAVAGDVVYIHEGIYYHRLVVRNSGTTSSPIVFRNYNNDVVIIETRETHLYAELNPAGLGRRWFGAVDFYNVSNIQFYGLNVRNVSLGAAFYGQRCNNIIIDNCKVSKAQNGGVNILLHGVQLDGSNNEIFPQDKSKWVFSTNITVRNSEFTGCVNSEYIGWTEVISMEGVDGFNIHNNHLFYNSAGDPANVWGGGGENIDAKRGSKNGLIHNNYVHNSPRVGLYIEGWDGDIENIKVYNNRVHDCRHAGIGIGVEHNGSVNNVQVYNNLFYDNVLGITFPKYNTTNQPVSNVSVYNNTVVDNNKTVSGWGAYGILMDNLQMSNIVIKNNIIKGHSNNHIARGSGLPAASYVVDKNLFWPVQSGQFMGTNFINSDPLFLAEANKNYRLQSSSPAINAGTNTLAAATDFDGNARPSSGGYEIGAHEFVGVTIPSVPSTPGGLIATPISYYRIDLSWNDVSNETGYVLERKTGSGVYEYVTQVNANVTSYTNFNVAPSTTYTYRVKAINNGGSSVFSATANATTAAAPEYESESNTATDGTLQTTNAGYEGTGYFQLGTYIEWNNVNVTEGGLYDIHYRYAHGTTNKPCNVIVNGINVGTLQFPSTGSWTKWQRAVLLNVPLNAGNNTIRLASTTGANSLNVDKMYIYGKGGAVLPDVTIPTAPSGLTATATSSSQINLAWTDNSSNETGFKIERKTGSSGTWVEIATVGANVKSYSNTGLAASTTYYYRVRAYNSAGNSGYSNESNATTNAAEPATSYQAEAYTAKNDAAFASSNGGYTGTGYMDFGGNGSYIEWNNVNPGAGTYDVVVRYANGGSGNRPCELIVNGVNIGTQNFGNTGSWSTWGTATFTGVALNSGNNTLRVRANTSAGGPNVDKMDLSAASITPTIPAKPSGLALTVVSSSQINLAWTDNSSNEDGFKIERKTGSSGTWGEIATVSANVISYSNSGLTASTTYYYRVRAYNSAGNSDFTPEANATTSAAGGGTGSFTQGSDANGLVVMEAENFTTKTAGTGTFSSLNWTSVSDATASNSAYMVVNTTGNDAGSNLTGPRMNYTINFVKSGTHYLWIRMKAASASDDSCIPLLNGTTLGNWYTGTASSWTWKKRTISGVTTGTHTFSIAMREDGLMIDKIIITSNNSYTPSGTGPVETKSGAVANTITDIDDVVTSDFQVYPNPAMGMVYIVTPNSNEPSRITLIDYSGRIIKQENSQSEKHSLNIEGVKPGLYLIKVETPGVIRTKLLVLQ